MEDLCPARRFDDEGLDVEELRSIGRGYVVIDRGEGAVRPSYGSIGDAKSLECLGGSDLVDEMSIDVEEGGEAVVVD